MHCLEKTAEDTAASYISLPGRAALDGNSRLAVVVKVQLDRSTMALLSHYSSLGHGNCW